MEKAVTPEFTNGFKKEFNNALLQAREEALLALILHLNKHLYEETPDFVNGIRTAIRTAHDMIETIRDMKA